MLNQSDIQTKLLAVISELVNYPRPETGMISPSGAVAIGKGLAGDVWALWQVYALKMFRHRTNMDIPKDMMQEITTYKKLKMAAESGLPKLYDHGTVIQDTQDAAPCGWALYSRLPGRTISYAEINALDPATRARWIRDFVFEAVKLETCLNGVVDPPQEWRYDYAGSRIPQLEKRVLRGVSTPEDLKLAYKLRDIIQQETTRVGFLHGDLWPPNAVTDLDAIKSSKSVVQFIDPLISLEAPEANWRHLTADQELADQLACEYDRQTGTTTNERLMYAVGALTHHHVLPLQAPDQKRVRHAAKHACLKKIGLT